MTDLSAFQPDPALAPQELRQSPRLKVRGTAWIVLMDYSEARSVSVKDISPDGARLSVGNWMFLPDTFHLLLQTSPAEPNFQIDCAIRWRAGDHVGVEFRHALASHVLDDLVGHRSVV